VLAHQDFADDAKDAGEIGAGHTVTALYEVVPRGVAVPAPSVDALRYQEPLDVPTDSAFSGELLNVRLRYKEPEGTTSRLLEVPVVDDGRSFRAASEDLRFAAAVAAFGMLLRDSRFAGDVTLEEVHRWAEDAQGLDPHGYRREFLRLVDRARALRRDADRSAR